MTTKELYDLILAHFVRLPGVERLLAENVTVRARSLSPEEAIGQTERKDYPILTGTDVMIEAEYSGCKGQAFTDAPSDFSGTLSDILALPFHSDPHARGLLIATINAVMGSMGLCDRMVHCKDDGPKRCGVEIASYIKAHYGDPKVLLVGYQPSILSNLAACFSQVRALDLNPDNIGQDRFGVIIGDGERDRQASMDWAELILCTGSTVCNGTLADYLDTSKETLFFGTTLAGVAALMQLPRLCFAD